MNKTHAHPCMIAALLALLPTLAAAQPTLDELLNLQPAPSTTQPATQPAPASVPVDPNVAKRLTEQEAADAFTQALEQMDQAAARLANQRDPGLQTQRLQESILAKLDQVIQAAQQQQQQQSGGSSSSGSSQPQGPEQGTSGNAQASTGSQTPASGNQSDPGNTQSAAARRGGETAGPMAETRNQWGNLPPRLRNELLEGLAEPFSPVYQEQTEAYYRRLAEEKR